MNDHASKNRSQDDPLAAGKLSQSNAELLHQLRQAFEQDFRVDERTQMEDYLSLVPAALRSAALRELIALEIEIRLDSELPVDVDDYLGRFPDEPNLVEFMLAQVSAEDDETPTSGPSQDTIVAERKLSGCAPGEAEIPTVFGRYRVVRKLGQGAMGAVFLAHDSQLDREVALKIPKFTDDEAAEMLTRFYREARAAAKLRHPNLCPVFDVGEIAGRHYISMAFIEGRQLAEIVHAHKRLSERKIAGIVRKIALGLAEAHAHGVIHRDLKPANIMVDTKGEPVVMDFGLARREERDDQRVTHAATIIGTPAYMSPEQVEGDQSQIGPPTDVYSLGVVMYELLTGRVPFGGTLLAILKQVAAQAPQPPSVHRPGLDPRLESICLKMMAKQVSDRYRDMEDAAEALAEYLHVPDPSERRLPVARRLEEFADPTPPPVVGSSATATAAQATLDHANTLTGNEKWPTMREPLAPSMSRKLKQHDQGAYGKTLIAVSAGVLGAAFLVLTVTLWLRMGKTNVKVVIDDPSLVVRVEGDKVSFSGSGKTIRLKPGEHTFIVERDGLEVETDSFVVKKENRNILQVSLVRGNVEARLDGKKIAKSGVLKKSKDLVAWEGWPKDAPPPAIAPFDAKQARMHQESWAKYLGVPVQYTNSLGMKFQLIPPGEFMMGSTQHEVDEELGAINITAWQEHIRSQLPRHRVLLTKPFYMGMHEVTQEQYQAVMRRNPSHYSSTGSGKDKVHALDTWSFPVETINWDQAVEFCAELGKREGLLPSSGQAGKLAGSGTLANAYRLPTEAEWEFACRAGTETRFWTGNQHQSVNQAAWLFGNSAARPHPVGELSPNPFNLHDVHGNAWEWVHDWWEPLSYKQFQTAAARDPTGPPLDRESRVIRGGSCFHTSTICPSAHRNAVSPGGVAGDIGFRAALSVDAVRIRLKNPQGSGQVTIPSLPDESSANFDAEDEVRLDFDGKDDYVLLPTLKVPEGPLTVEARILGTTGRGNIEVIATAAGIRQWHSMYLQEGAAGTVFGRGKSDGYLLHKVPPEMTGRMIHLAAQWDGENFQFFFNGTKTGSRSPWREWVHKPENYTSSLGGEFSTPPGWNQQVPWIFFRGQIAEARYSKIARYQKDFQPKTRLESDGDTLALYHFDEGQGEELRDSSGNNHHGKIVGAQWVRSKSSSNAEAAWNGWPKDAPPPAIAPFDATTAKRHQEAWAKHLGVPVEYTNSIGMKFRLVPPGEFQLGCTEQEANNAEQAMKNSGVGEAWASFVAGSSQPRRPVRLTKGYYMGVHEVTVGQFRTFVQETDYVSSAHGVDRNDRVWMKKAGDAPMSSINWHDTQAFCKWLSAKDKRVYQIPTEAQWEFACRSGAEGHWSWGDDAAVAPEYAWMKRERTEGPSIVGVRKANPFGLFDMHGNLHEWCFDWHHRHTNLLKIQNDPVQSERKDAAGRVLRGGSWQRVPLAGQSGLRHYQTPEGGGDEVGFRVSISVESRKTPEQPGPIDRGAALHPARTAPPPAIAPFDATTAKRHQEAWAKHLGVPIEYTNSIGIKFRLIPPGEFVMGTSPADVKVLIDNYIPNGYWNEATVRSQGPQHRVVLTKPYYLGAHEVTQEHFQDVMHSNPSQVAPRRNQDEQVGGKAVLRHPVEHVTWDECQEFCKKLCAIEKLDFPSAEQGRASDTGIRPGYRLPTEAQWEFACRAGTTTRCFSGDAFIDIMKTGWVRDNSGTLTHPVGELAPNPFGLFDMHGNVEEWCDDEWHADAYARAGALPVVDPRFATTKNVKRVVRGGNCFSFWPQTASSSSKTCAAQGDRWTTGLRLSLSVEAVRAATTPEQKGKSTEAQGLPPPADSPFDAAAAKMHQEAWARHLGVPVEVDNSIGLKLRLVPATLKTRAFYLGACEVTQAQYETVLGENPSHFSKSGEGKGFVENVDTSNFPVENVTIRDAQRFCEMLSARQAEHQVARLYRLPTQQEWLVACEAGVVGPFHTGNSISSKQANFNGNGPFGGAAKGDFLGRPTVVGAYLPNAFGLFDMHGNISEYCISPQFLRGGSWNHLGADLRTEIAFPHLPANRSKLDGFRIALTVEPALANEKIKSPE